MASMATGRSLPSSPTSARAEARSHASKDAKLRTLPVLRAVGPAHPSFPDRRSDVSNNAPEIAVFIRADEPIKWLAFNIWFLHRLDGQLFPKNNPMTVWSDDRKFAYSPRLVCEFVPNLHTIPDGF